MNRLNRDASILRHMSAHCEKIGRSVARFGRDRETFIADEDYHDSVTMSVLQIGELAGHLSDEFRAAHAEIPWRQIKQLRNIAVHQYETLNYKTVWDILTDDIPQLAAFCAKTLDADAPQD